MSYEPDWSRMDAPPEIENKTPIEGEAPKPSEIKYQTKTLPNVLNNYRSVTYNFTLAGLPSNYLSDPEAYRKGELDLVILKSAGKGPLQMGEPIGPTAKEIEIAKSNRPEEDRASDAANARAVALQEITGFNKESPGRFDMFIENINIETLMTFNQHSNTTLPLTISFTVVEPYSINGFIEALHVAAMAAGYTSYVSASYLLKLEFWGYPDNEHLPSPKKIPNSERYFVIGLTGVEVEVTEHGTRYMCKAVPFNDRGFGNPNVIKKPIKMEGKKVKEILKNLEDSLNQQLRQSDSDGKTNGDKHDEYKIEFRKKGNNGSWIEDPDSEIGNQDLAELFNDNILYKFAKPDEGQNAYKPGTNPESITYNPTSMTVNFPDKMNVHDAIVAVIRDSKYVRDLLRDLSTGSRAKIDAHDRVNYFMIRLEVTNKNVYDNITKKPFQKFTYIITPYKVHLSRIPTYGNIQVKEEKLKKIALKEYNYMYTGKNIDVLNFKLNFNTLYFEAVPASMGDKNAPNSRESLNPDGKSKEKIKEVTKEVQEQNQSQPLPAQQTVPGNSQEQQSGATAPLNDPYHTLARTMHEAVVNSKASMLTGEIEILGDPYYLVTGGVGNYNPKEVKEYEGLVGEYEADHTAGELRIRINFRNPVDIGSDGFLKFDPKRIPFSGVYMVTKVGSTFKDGVFKQRLEIIRMQGQILEGEEVTVKDTRESAPIEENLGVIPPPGQAAPSRRPGLGDLASTLNRAIPNIGLPGQLSNFTNAAGGLGNAINSAIGGGLSGLTNGLSALTSAAGIIGQALPNNLATEMRLNASNLAGLANSALGVASLVSSAANVLTGGTNSAGAFGNLANSISSGAQSILGQAQKLGSGIGQISNIIPGNISQDQLGSFQDLSNNLTSNALSSVNELGANASSLINGLGSKIDSSLGSIADPGALGAKLGLDLSKLSGLSKNFQSNAMNEIKSAIESIPENVNLPKAFNEGLALDLMPLKKIPNIPASAPFAVADLPEVEAVFYSNLKPPINPITSLSQGANSTVGKLGALAQGATSVDSNIVRDKISTVQSQIGSVTGKLNNPDISINGSVNSMFGSKSSLTSPLNKLINGR